MKNLSISIAGLMGFVLVAALGLVALKQADELWASLAYSAALIAPTAALLHAIFSQGRGRAFGAGFAIVGWIYLIVSFGPLRPDNVSPPSLIFNVVLERLQGILHPEQADFITPYSSYSVNITTSPFSPTPLPQMAGAPPLLASAEDTSSQVPEPSVDQQDCPADTGLAGAIPEIPIAPPAPPLPVLPAPVTATMPTAVPTVVATYIGGLPISLYQVGHSLAALLFAQIGGYYAMWLAARRERARGQHVRQLSPSSP